MKLLDFLTRFSCNNLIRIITPVDGGHKPVLDDWKLVTMDWEVAKGGSIFEPYKNNKVLGVVGIAVYGEDSTIINISIENNDNQ